jgi:hypothetical protein
MQVSIWIMDTVAESADRKLVVLDRSECLRLLATVPVGRLIFTAGALPTVKMMNFVHDVGPDRDEQVALTRGPGHERQGTVGGEGVDISHDRRPPRHGHRPLGQRVLPG